MSTMKLVVKEQKRNPLPEIKRLVAIGLHEISQPIISTAQDEVPVLTGGTRDSIKVEVNDEKAELIFSVGAPKGPHPRLIEWGTVHSKANPFVRRTFSKLKLTIREMVAKAVKRTPA